MGGLLAGLGSLVSGGINYFSNRETNQANEEMTRASNDTNLQIARERNAAEVALWDKQTAYNAPQAQMQRLQAAGLNPNLAYGQIAESKMSNPPDLATPTVEPAHFNAFKMDSNPVADYQQVRNLQALNTLQNANIDKTISEAKSAKAKSDYDVFAYSKLKDTGTLPGDPSNLRTGKSLWQYVKDFWNGPDWDSRKPVVRTLEVHPQR